MAKLKCPSGLKQGVSFYHTAIVYPTRKNLALILKRLNDYHNPIIDVAGHGISKAIYLMTQTEMVIELYWDRPKDE